MQCLCKRRWCCWACLLVCGQGAVLLTSALLHILYRSTNALELASLVAPPQEDVPVEQNELAAEPLLKAWAWKYGVALQRATSKPEAWVMCPGRMKKKHMVALKAKVGDSYVISLNRYFHPPVFKGYGLMPTHHWHYAPEKEVSGYCLKELKKAQKDLAKRQQRGGKRTFMKFEEGYGECFVAQEAALAASKSGIPFISTPPVIKLLRTLAIPFLLPHLHAENEWLEDHPLPIALDDLTLLHGIGIAVSLTPQGSTIKLVGCTGFDGKKNIKSQSRRLREKIRMLQRVGPGWDVVNCDPKSEYVKLGAMPGVTCIDSRDSEYDLEHSSNLTR